MNTRYQGFTIISSAVWIVVVITLLGLGVWQLSRMQEKEAQLADIAAASDKSSVAFETLSTHSLPSSGTQVVLNGKVDKTQIWLLDNQLFERQVGYKVLAVVESANANVLVDFGWIKAPQARDSFPEVVLPNSVSELEAVLSRPSNNVFVDSSVVETKNQGDAQISRIQAIDSKAFETVLVATGDSNVFQRFWQPVVMPPEKHLGYAIQWFGLAIAAFIIGFLVLRKK